MSSDPLKLFLFENDRSVFDKPLTAPLEVGRQRVDEVQYPPNTLRPAELVNRGASFDSVWEPPGK
ncbi:MAG: hypothetical protein HYS12_08695 [Planctomycetes bacterium]|nr:hypothetical protein [Planctomycetota bacterium]